MATAMTLFIKRSKFVVASALLALTVAAAGVVSFTQPGAASAAACDSVNIVYCGLDGSGLNGYINSFQAKYNSGSDHGHSDLKTVFSWAGASGGKVSGMSSSNTKLGTMYRNGDVKVDGKLVAHDAWVSARFGAGQSGFTHVSGDVWARKTTTSLENSSNPVIVHFNSAGDMDFAVMVTCGNAVRATPVHKPTPPPKPTPKAALSCTSLQGTMVGTSRKYKFVATASASNTTISKYIFDFGDGTKQTVTSSGAIAATNHTYPEDTNSYTARVAVYSNDFKDGKTSSNCTYTMTPPSATPSLACVSLASNGSGLTYTFTATAAAQHVAITSYNFHFSDGTSKTVQTGQTTASLEHTFNQADTDKSVYVTVTGGSTTTARSDVCSANITTPTTPPEECQPGIPVGDERCQETPVTPVSQLVNTGPGEVAALFCAVMLAGSLIHHFVSRRKYNA